MRIQNLSSREIRYELKAGTPRMTMSTCDLLPGEEELWRSPYRKLGGSTVCFVHVTEGESRQVVEAEDDDTVLVEDAPGGVTVRVA